MKTPFEQAQEMVEQLCVMVEAQNAALKIALEFIHTVGTWNLPYANEAANASDRINEQLAKVKPITV